ncbi:MAG: type pilus assembly protein PilN [Pyrinomonadaceae bacterium]|jgi:Tfp pilus assembly protein PilN|nr:type pilus assembly protein PilN [Pyrinomonadaceae bacterium]MDQ1728709.1 type pilus assembly protein PilN [Pyrinomonadaceae bacterium]
MPTKVNLASKPFSNRSLPWAVTAVIIFVSLISLIFIMRANSRARSEAALAQNDLNHLQQQERQLGLEAQAVKKSLTSEQLQTLAAAHTLVDRKRFSWSRLFSDLELALPGNVRVKSIAVREVATRGDSTLAELELSVVAKSPEIVTGMIAEMNRGGIFQAQLKQQTLQRGRGESGAEYELTVVYQPRAGSPVTTVAAITSATNGGEKRGSQ